MKTLKTQRVWEEIGVVGVDSGQIVICDPCYIDGEWRRDTPAPGHEPLRLTAKGRATFPKAKKQYVFPKDFSSYEAPIPSLGGFCANELKGQGYLEPVPHKITGEFSYRGCCLGSIAGDHQLNYKLGHAGAGVALSSGYGDGTYRVYILRDLTGRIREARIKFF